MTLLQTGLSPASLPAEEQGSGLRHSGSWESLLQFWGRDWALLSKALLLLSERLPSGDQSANGADCPHHLMTSWIWGQECKDPLVTSAMGSDGDQTTALSGVGNRGEWREGDIRVYTPGEALRGVDVTWGYRGRLWL
jgi:hypothetical protein